MKTDILLNGSMVKNQFSLERGFEYSSSLVNEFVLRIWSVNFKDTFKTGESLFNIFFKLVFTTNSWWNQDSKTRGSNWEWIESDISPVTVTTTVDDRSGQPVVNQANKIPTTPKKSHRQIGVTRCLLKSRSGCKISRKFWGRWNFWTKRLTHQFFSWSIFRAHMQGTWRFG